TDCSSSTPDINPLVGCFSDISTQLTFEGLTVQTKLDFTILKEKCIMSLDVGNLTNQNEYCIVIGGLMYKLLVDPGVPKLYSLSRLKSGAQTLTSPQGDVDEEQACTGITYEADCQDRDEFCCWSEGKCSEGSCSCASNNEYCDNDEDCCTGLECKNNKCKKIFN
ncbi:MAG: hypothetical protein KKA79_10350, partial [Nanoarchaeota archaeon]|nr:hypothetical protein [Nanoarchaeota archaeon]